MYILAICLKLSEPLPSTPAQSVTDLVITTATPRVAAPVSIRLAPVVGIHVPQQVPVRGPIAPFVPPIVRIVPRAGNNLIAPLRLSANEAGSRLMIRYVLLRNVSLSYKCTLSLLFYRPINRAAAQGQHIVNEILPVGIQAAIMPGRLLVTRAVGIMPPRPQVTAVPLRYELLSANPGNGSYER